MTELSYSQAVHVLGRCPMDNRVAGYQPPTGATPLLRFGLPSPPNVVGMVMAPGSASGKHPFYVVCRCGLGCCVCGGRRVGVGALGDAPRAWFVCGRRWLCVGEKPMWWVWPPPWVLGVGLVLVLAAGGVAVRRCCCGTLLCFALLTMCCVLSCAGAFHCVPLPALVCCVALCATLPPRCALRCLREAWWPRLPGQGRSPRWGRVRVTSKVLG